MKTMKYGEAIRQALAHAMEKDPRVFVLGIGVDDHRAIFGTTRGLPERFSKNRVFDTPISEGAMTGVAIGAALGGLRPVHVHIRSDFLYLAMDQLCNMAAKWRSMFGGTMSVPLVVRAVIGRSWGQGAQHSQALQSLFAHIPGLKVAMPTTAADAHDLLLAGIEDPNPVLLFEHRLLYDLEAKVEEPKGHIPFRRTVVRRQGKDVTVCANSYMVVEALKAAEYLEKEEGISLEIVDPVTIVPMDETPLLRSLEKTGRLIAADVSWTRCGVSAEIAALAAEKAFGFLKAPVKRVGMAPAPCPVSKPLENLFYANAGTIAAAALELMGRKPRAVSLPALPTTFKGPF